MGRPSSTPTFCTQPNQGSMPNQSLPLATTSPFLQASISPLRNRAVSQNTLPSEASPSASKSDEPHPTHHWIGAPHYASDYLDTALTRCSLGRHPIHFLKVVEKTNGFP